MQDNTVILRIFDAVKQSNKLNKILGNVRLSSFVDLISKADLDANPREAKRSTVTDDIEESLENEREIFQFMTKGILVAAETVEELDRNRFRLTFKDPRLEGILDGGHNTLAIGRHILEKTLLASRGDDAATSVLRQVRHWDDLKSVWDEYGEDIHNLKDTLDPTLVPIEIIYPSDDADGLTYFQDKILKINAARNNNAQLTEETKANKRGLYDELRNNLAEDIRDEVEWKANEGGRLKARDLVALALIPLSKLGFPETRPVSENSTVIFSQKGQCIKIYNDLLMSEKNEVVERVTGELVQVIHPRVKNALKLMADIPRLYDLIYELLPEAYNEVSPGFGRIRGVKIFEGEKKYSENKDRYLRKPAQTRFHRKEVKYDYGEGYIYPLVVSLGTLIEVHGDEVRWKTNPDDFIRNYIDEVMKTYKDMIVAQDYDPARVGKMGGAYNVVARIFESAMQALEFEKFKAQYVAR